MTWIAPYIAIGISVIANVALIAYAWGSLRQVVLDLKEVVRDLKAAVDGQFPRINSLENRIGRMEAVCAERHKEHKKP